MRRFARADEIAARCSESEQLNIGLWSIVVHGTFGPVSARPRNPSATGLRHGLQA